MVGRESASALLINKAKGLTPGVPDGATGATQLRVGSVLYTSDESVAMYILY